MALFLSFLILAKFYLDSIDFNSHKGVCLLLLIPIIAAVFPFPIFAGLFGGFRLVLRSLKCLILGFLGLSLWFFGPEILHWRGLSIKFDDCNTTALGTLLINLMGVKTRPESGFGLGIDRFFNYLIKFIEFQAMLFHFYSHWEFQVFSKVPNHRAFF